MNSGKGRVSGKVVIITGGGTGLGKAMALALAREGADIVLTARRIGPLEETAREVTALGCRALAISTDVTDSQQVNRMVEQTLSQMGKLDVLINNAGIGSGAGERETSQDGYELRFAVNFLAGFLLTRLLLPLMMVSKAARIVNVSSLAQHAIDFEDLMLTRDYTGGRAYAQSKLAQIMFTFDLAREFDPAMITANCLHPATYMATTMVRQSGVTPISTVEEGAEAILNLAVSHELDGRSGEFYNGLGPSRANAQAYDVRARERLRLLSMSLTGLG
jgi:NAD(P)-dependent dehydrogenase (short-subunit alcohol dehydrogenase family)